MIARKLRLPVKTFKPTKTISTPYFSLKFSSNSLSYNRISAIISNKVDKRAAYRHFLKRRFIENLKTWPNLGKDFLIIATPEIKNLEPDDLKQKLNSVLKKINGHQFTPTCPELHRGSKVEGLKST